MKKKVKQNFSPNHFEKNHIKLKKSPYITEIFYPIKTILNPIKTLTFSKYYNNFYISKIVPQ